MQKVHSVKKSPTEINTKKLKLEKCVVKGNLLHRPKGERPLRRKDERTPSKTENKVVDKKEETSPGKEEDKALSKKQEKIPDNLTFSKASDMREIVCGECGIESKGCFACQLHCNNKHSTKSICCFFCKKFATVSVRHMMYHIIDVHKKMNLKFYHIPKTDKHSKIAYKFTCLFNRKNAILNKSITTTNRLFGWRDAPKRLKRKDRKKSESAPSDKEKKTSASEKLSKASYSARNIDTTDHYKCVAVKGCGFVNQKYDVMHVHIQKHLNYKPFKCGICGMLFHMEQHVKMHHTRLHGPDQKVNFTVKRIAATEEKIARCLRTGNPHYFVNKTFTVEDFKKVRNGPKRLYKEFGGKRTVFKCIECPFESNKKQEMTFHVYKHLPQFYKCPFCNHTGYPRFLVIEHIAEVHPTENASTPVINLMDTNWKRWMKSTSGQKKEPNSASQPDSSDTDVYSGEEARVPCKRRKSAKVSGIPDNILESSDSDIVQPSKKAKVTAGAARKRDRIPSDSEEEDENVSRRKCLKRKMSTSSKKASLTSSSDSDEEEDDESEEDIEDSNSVQDTDEKYKEEDDEEGVATPPRRKRHQILSDCTDYGPTHYFCHQCPFHTEDLEIYCRHLVTHGGFNQLCPRLLPKDLQKPVEEELGRFMEGTSKKKGSAFLCAYCNYMAETSFRVKQHIQINHPDNYTDYMEIHTKYDTTNVMLVAMQPSIVMTDICKMDLIDLALMLKHEGVTMNSTKNHPCEKEKSDNTRPGSAGEKKRKKFSIMSPSKYYKKTISHTDVRQADRFSDEKVDEKIRTEDSQTNKGGDCVESRDGGSESTPNLFNALVKLTQEDKNVTEGFENVIAEYLSAEDKNKSLTAKAVNVCNNSQLDCVRSSGTGVNSSKTGTTSSLGRGEPKNTLTSSAMPENCHEDFEIEKNSPNNERSTLNFQEMSFETKAMSNPAENLADQTCEEVKNMVPANVGVTTVSSTTDHVDTSDWSVYSDVSDCSDSILSKDDNLCEEIPAVTERASISFSTLNQSCCSPCSSGCVEGEHSGKQKALPSATSTTKKGGNSLPSEITGDNVMSSIDSMLDSLSDIKHKHVMNSPVKHSSNQKRTHSSDILSSPLVNSTNQHKSKDSNNTTKSLESKDADIIINRPDSQDSDNESCHSIGFEVNTDSQEL
ncbi:uncharacterized protein LOC132553568 [Ylistrum balloti]|uniref:uncharacterized protein LOC132553568 n=1 Tax=Ylistrum balloti TaxID=509963 RepID=UPI002905E881|nr:uncharacterized protein LOC132553568 [Ylistrum balloti]